MELELAKRTVNARKSEWRKAKIDLNVGRDGRQ